jgi:hypothetical protein
VASTVTGFTWSDDTGTPAAPAGDGTTINNAELQKIFAEVDALFSGAGAFATLTMGGLIQVDGAGVSVFDGTGSAGGLQGIRVRNTGSNTDDAGYLAIGNDTAADSGVIEAYSSLFTETGAKKQDGLAIRASGDGGIAIAAEHASGLIELYAGGTTKSLTFNGDEIFMAGGERGAAAIMTTPTLAIQNADSGNAADTNWAEIWSWTAPVGTFAEDSRIIRVTNIVDFNTTNSKDIRWVLGTTNLGTASAVTTQGEFVFQTYVVRTSEDNQLITHLPHGFTLDSLQNFYTATEDDGVDIKIAFQGKSNAAVANDVVHKLGFVEILR